MRKEKQMNGIHRQSIVRPRLPLILLLFFLYFLMHIRLLIIIFFFLFPLCVYRTTKHQLGRYIVLYIDGKNAYDPVCRIILKRSKPVSAQWVLSFYIMYKREKKKEKKKKLRIIQRKMRERTRESEREIWRYMYIYKPSASLILVRRAQKATRQICVVSPCVCVC